jgi:hypothetical protein
VRGGAQVRWIVFLPRSGTCANQDLLCSPFDSPLAILLPFDLLNPLHSDFRLSSPATSVSIISCCSPGTVVGGARTGGEGEGAGWRAATTSGRPQLHAREQFHLYDEGERAESGPGRGEGGECSQLFESFALNFDRHRRTGVHRFAEPRAASRDLAGFRSFTTTLTADLHQLLTFPPSDLVLLLHSPKVIRRRVTRPPPEISASTSRAPNFHPPRSTLPLLLLLSPLARSLPFARAPSSLHLFARVDSPHRSRQLPLPLRPLLNPFTHSAMGFKIVEDRPTPPEVYSAFRLLR